MKRITKEREIRDVLSREIEKTGGVFRLAPAWVGRPGIIVPGRRIKLVDDYINREVVVNERWFASVTYADNGAYNKICPEDHGLSYIVSGDKKIQLKDALDVNGNVILGKGRKWDVLSKVFDNWNRIPHHLHPCDKHVRKGLTGKPESYYFPYELNMNKNAFPVTYAGVDGLYSDKEILKHIADYYDGDNRITDISQGINLTPGTGWYMPPCTLHAPGSLVTYELQVASDVSVIPESRVNDMVMPEDMLDRDIPVTVKKDGREKVFKYILEMVNCRNSGNKSDFRREFFRPPVTVFKNKQGEQKYVIYRTGRRSEKKNPDLYSAKKTTVFPGQKLQLNEKSAFGIIVLRGHGKIGVQGKEYLNIESPSLYETRNEIFADEVFVSKSAAGKIEIVCESAEPVSFCQHFASDSNPESATIKIPEV